MLKLPGHAEVRAQESRGKLGNQLFGGVGVIAEALAEGPGQPTLMAGPMAKLV